MYTSLLDETAYVSSIKNVIEDTVANNNEAESLLLCNTIKCQVRGATIRYSSIKNEKGKTRLNLCNMRLIIFMTDYIVTQIMKIVKDLRMQQQSLSKSIS